MTLNKRTDEENPRTRSRRVLDAHENNAESRKPSIDYTKENGGKMRSIRNLSMRIYALLHRSKTDERTESATRQRGTRRTRGERTTITNRKERRYPIMDRLIVFFGGVVHWFKQGSIRIGRLQVPRHVLAIVVVVIGLATSGTVLAKALMDDDAENLDIQLFREKTFNVSVVYHDAELQLTVTEMTVGELLESHDIVLKEHDRVSPKRDTPIEEGMKIVIDGSFQVNLDAGGVKRSITMNSGTVADVLKNAGIELDEHDEVTPAVTTPLDVDMEIVYRDVEVTHLVETQVIDYEVEEGKTNTVNVGYYHIEQEGEDGELEITTEIRLINGEEVSREVVSEEVVKEPVNKVILHGTATPKKKSSDDDDSSDSSDSESDDDDDPLDEYEGIKVTNPNEQATNPSVPSAPSSYLSTMSGHVTAYTHTGRTTATGTWPRSTRTLSNPGSCAVVPATIPYGSLIYVTGYGYAIAEDTGGFRHDPDRWNQIDLFMNTKAECYTWGRRRDVKVYILRKGY